MREARDSSTWRTGELSLATVTAGTSGVTEADGMTGLAVGTVSVTLTGAVWGNDEERKVSGGGQERRGSQTILFLNLDDGHMVFIRICFLCLKNFIIK